MSDRIGMLPLASQGSSERASDTGSAIGRKVAEANTMRTVMGMRKPKRIQDALVQEEHLLNKSSKKSQKKGHKK